MKVSIYVKKAITAGVISLCILLLGTVLLGKLSGYEAKVLIKKSMSGINTLCNTVALASATILALLLTVLSISSNSKSKLKREHYIQVIQIARLDTIVFVAAIISFVLLNLPITESDTVPDHWFTMIYYISLAISSILTAGLIVVVLMLYSTIVSVIEIVGLHMTDHPLAVVEKAEEIEEEEEEEEEEED